MIIYKNQFVIILIFVEIFTLIISCKERVFVKHLSVILAVNSVEVKKSWVFDEFAGFGEGYTLEIYKLSGQTIDDFLNNSSKILTTKIESNKQWQKKRLESNSG